MFTNIPQETELEKFPFYLNHGPVCVGQQQDYTGYHGPNVACLQDVSSLDAILEDEHPTGDGPDHRVMMSATTQSSSTSAMKCESLAKEKLKQKAFSFKDLAELSELVPLKHTRKHRGISGGPESSVDYFFAGLYTHGPFTGITQATSSFPWLTRYINAFGREKVDQGWSSWILGKNIKSNLHSDNHNQGNSTVTCVTFGDFSGGEMWIEDEDGTIIKTDANGKNYSGKLVNTKEAPYVFDPKAKHCTEDWSGTRWTLIFFTPRGYSGCGPTDRDRLRDLRFPLRGLPVEERHHDFARAPRPCKSVRKGLWKTAKRIASMAAWCTTAASTWITGEHPLGRKQGAAVLFEVGDFTKTLEIGDSDFFCMEPLLPEDFEPPHILQEIKKNVEEFEPETMWVHASKVTGHFEHLRDALEVQVQGGRPLILEFTADEDTSTVDG